MDTAAIGVTEKEDDEQSIDEQDIFYRMGFFLAALTRGLFSRVLGADDTPFRAVMSKRGDAGATSGTMTPAVDSSSTSGVTTVAASASETPGRCARALRHGAGA